MRNLTNRVWPRVLKISSPSCHLPKHYIYIMINTILAFQRILSNFNINIYLKDSKLHIRKSRKTFRNVFFIVYVNSLLMEKVS